MRILITGASGFLGHALAAVLSRTHDVYAGRLNSLDLAIDGTPLRFDIRSAEEIRGAFEVSRPECVIHTAALTKPDYCEGRPEETRLVNVEGSEQVARRCIEHGAKLIHISTDLVFDGAKGNYSEDDPVSGINEYSRSKIDAERAVLSVDSGAAVLRVSVMYGPGNSAHPGFLDEMMGRWRRREPMSFFTDQFRTPTFTPQVAEVVERILEQREVAGVFHLGGAERLSRYQFAQLVGEAVGAPHELIKPGSMHDHPGLARRGPDCSLVSEKIMRTLGLKPVKCVEGLSHLLETGYLRRLQRAQ